jgi:hypothetical protein
MTKYVADWLHAYLSGKSRSCVPVIEDLQGTGIAQIGKMLIYHASLDVLPQ